MAEEEPTKAELALAQELDIDVELVTKAVAHFNRTIGDTGLSESSRSDKLLKVTRNLGGVSSADAKARLITRAGTLVNPAELALIDGISKPILSGILEALYEDSLDHGETVEAPGEFDDPSIFEISDPVPEEKGQQCWCGPDAAIKGWIPYYLNFLTMQTKIGMNDWIRLGRSSTRLNVGLIDLFDSGNPTPAANYAGSGAFVNSLNNKEFRSAMYLRNVRLCCDETGPKRITYRYFSRGGYTPARILWAPNMKGTHGYMAGVGSPGRQVTWTNNCATISFWLRFKLGKIGNLGSYIFTGAWAPWAWVMLEYKICCDGIYKIDFVGSRVPSQRYYIDWALNGSYDMMGATQAQAKAFLNAGDCLDSPGIVHHTAQGNAKPC